MISRVENEEVWTRLLIVSTLIQYPKDAWMSELTYWVTDEPRDGSRR